MGMGDLWSVGEIMEIFRGSKWRKSGMWGDGWGRIVKAHVVGGSVGGVADEGVMEAVNGIWLGGAAGPLRGGCDGGEWRVGFGVVERL